MAFVERSALRNAAKRVGLLTAALTLAALSHAGDLSFTPGTWTSIVRTGSTATSTLATLSDSYGLGGTLGLTATASGTYTVQATWNFTVSWTPTTVGETAPTSVTVRLYRSGTPTVAGTGVAKVTAGTTDLVNVTSTKLWMSGMTLATPDIVMSVPLSANVNGTYTGTGTVVSDVVSVTYNATTSTSTSCVESFSLGDLTEVY